MKRVVLLVSALLLACSLCHAEAWKFVSMADSRGSDNGVNTSALSQIVTLVNAENPDLVIFQGDNVNGYTSAENLRSQLQTWKAVMADLNCPYYACPGNHDVQDESHETVWQEEFDFPLNGPPGEEECVFSFDHKNAHFILLNSSQPGMSHRIQQSWLEDDLAAAGSYHTFVGAHEPAYPGCSHIGSSLDAYPTDRDIFWQTLVDWGVGAYFAGHEHFYHRSTHDGVVQSINGTCGAPIVCGSFYHFMVVEVDGAQVSARCIDVNGVQRDSWSYTDGEMTFSPPTRFETGWNLMSLPLMPPEAAVEDALNDVAAVNNLTNAMYAYSESLPGYQIYPGQFTQMEGGARARGYWLYLTTAPVTETLVGKATGGRAEFPLAVGWNLIGYPHTTEIAWSSCKVRNSTGLELSIAGAVWSDWIQEAIFTYSGGSYVTVMRTSGDDTYVRPWYGYWLLVFEPDLTLVIPKP